MRSRPAVANSERRAPALGPGPPSPLPLGRLGRAAGRGAVILRSRTIPSARRSSPTSGQPGRSPQRVDRRVGDCPADVRAAFPCASGLVSVIYDFMKRIMNSYAMIYRATYEIIPGMISL